MKNNTTIYLAIFAVLLGVLYFFKDKIFGGSEGAGANEGPDENINIDSIEPNPEKPTDATSTVVVKSGSNGEIAESCQRLINTIIYVCKTTGGEWTSNWNRQHIAKVSGLVVDGNFGTKSCEALKAITGKTYTTKKELYSHLSVWTARKGGQVVEDNSPSAFWIIANSIL